jgi:hypothetical protein
MIADIYDSLLPEVIDDKQTAGRVGYRAGPPKPSVGEGDPRRSRTAPLMEHADRHS